MKAILGMTAALAAVLTACTSHQHSHLDSPNVTRGAATAVATPHSYGGVALGGRDGPCSVALPAAWARAMQSGVLWQDETRTHFSGVPMPDEDAVLSEEDAADTATITLRGRDHRVLATVARIARPAGSGSMLDAVSDGQHVAFVYSTAPLSQVP